MIRLGYHDWSLRLISNSSEGYCWIKRKIIDLGLSNKCPEELLIHEIAHIDTCRFCNNKHHLEFWRRYKELMRKFLPEYKLSAGYNENGGFLEDAMITRSKNEEVFIFNLALAKINL